MSRFYLVKHWMGKSVQLDENHFTPASIKLTPEQIVDLADKYDVMIQSVRFVNKGTKKNPKMIEIPDTIYLDDKERRFTQR